MKEDRVNTMKTPARTTLPINPRERQVHTLKHSIIYGCVFYFVFVLFVYKALIQCWDWWLFCFNSPAMVRPLEAHVAYSMILILILAPMIPVGDIHFYERYVEIRRFLPFMKRQVIYYDMMYVHIMEGTGLVILNHYETLPRFWKSPYTWLKIYYSDSILFYFIHTPNTRPPRVFDYLLLYSNSEIMEFLKTKTQSVSYNNNPMWQKLNT